MIIKNVSNLVKNKQAIMEKFDFTGKLLFKITTFCSYVLVIPSPLGKCLYLSPQLLTASTTPPTLQRERRGRGRGNGNTT